MAATKKPTTKRTATKKAAPTKAATTKAATTKSRAATEQPAPTKTARAANSTAPTKTTTATKSTAPTKSSGATKTATRTTAKAGTKKASASNPRGGSGVASAKPKESDADVAIPAPRGVTKDGIQYTKDFDVKFLKTQHDLLASERLALVGQASRLEDEANSLIEDGEMGDVQFDDESGEGDTMVVERERDLALSAQARQTVIDIDAALARLAAGTYGYSIVSGRPIPRERLEAIPWATVLVEEKVGGIGRR